MAVKATKTVRFNTTFDLTAKALANCERRIEQLEVDEAKGNPIVLRMLAVAREQRDVLQAVLQALQGDCVNLRILGEPGLHDND